MRKRGAQIRARHNGVDKSVLKRELRRLKPFGKFLANGVADDALAGKPDKRVRLGQDDVAVHSKRSRHAAGGGIGKHRDVRQMRLGVALDSARRLRHLHKRHKPLLHARAARSGEDDDGQVQARGALEQARDFLAHHVAHRAHEKR